MVLSNKKLKQKLRSLLAESLAAAESGKPARDAAGPDGVDQQLQSLKELLVSRNHRKSGSSRRVRKRKKPSSPPEDSTPVEGSEGTQKGEEGEAGDPARPKKKKKRRKIEEGGGAAESTEQNKRETKKKEKKKKQKNKKRKQKNKKKEKKENDGKGNGSTNGGSDENKVVESAKVDVSVENGDAARKVYVGGIPYYSTEDDIRSFFEGCGTVTEVDCMTFPESGKFRGIAILTFKTEAAAKRAFALDGADMGGLYLKIQPYKATRSHKSDFAPEFVAGYNRIYVGNLSWDITEDELRNMFSDCKISSIRFGEDKTTGEFKGYAHVDFNDSPSLAIALKLDQMVVCGRPVKITCAVPKKGMEINTASKPLSKSTDGNTSSGNAGKKWQMCDEPASKSTDGNTSSGNAEKKKRQMCDEPASKSVDSKASSGNAEKRKRQMCDEPASKSLDSNTSMGNAKKKKRQTCYECGTPGHISSACPQKKVVEAVNSSGSS